MHTSVLLATPKIHKQGCPLPPIVSGCDDPTEHLCTYIIHFIQPLASNVPSHIKDTKHFLNLTKKLPPLPLNALLVVADATFLYTNIPNEEGIASVIHFMQECKHLLPTNCPLLHIVRITLDFILKYSTFKFMDMHMHQIIGTSMGELG